MRRRRATGLAFVLVLAATHWPARADDATGRALVLEGRAGVAADAMLSDARGVIDDAFGLALGASAGRAGSPWRGRLTVELAPVTDVGPGASLALFAARLGVERSWRRRLVTAIEVGAVARRLSISDEITRTSSGPGIAVELGWRLPLGARWALEPAARYEAAWYTRDGFIWQQVGLLVAFERVVR
jgi:hypothetical protein